MELVPVDIKDSKSVETKDELKRRSLISKDKLQAQLNRSRFKFLREPCDRKKMSIDSFKRAKCIGEQIVKYSNIRERAIEAFDIASTEKLIEDMNDEMEKMKQLIFKRKMQHESRKKSLIVKFNTALANKPSEAAQLTLKNDNMMKEKKLLCLQSNSKLALEKYNKLLIRGNYATFIFSMFYHMASCVSELPSLNPPYGLVHDCYAKTRHAGLEMEPFDPDLDYVKYHIELMMKTVFKAGITFEYVLDYLDSNNMSRLEIMNGLVSAAKKQVILAIQGRDELETDFSALDQMAKMKQQELMMLRNEISIHKENIDSMLNHNDEKLMLAYFPPKKEIKKLVGKTAKYGPLNEILRKLESAIKEYYEIIDDSKDQPQTNLNTLTMLNELDFYLREACTYITKYSEEMIKLARCRVNGLVTLHKFANLLRDIRRKKQT
ncbi:hypothetical protein Ciccas_001506 [Cichlidogyrus casuarinus]|uniref:Uncharacterized protein n=1 Tax=Cichlidogyrus casuarinus TaxID=1844966 RepID=A0ABD2QJU8_9PLAT